VTGLRIMGMGNARMGDDGVGLRVVKMLQELRDRGGWETTAELVAAGDDATAVAAALAEGQRVLLVDAVEMGGRPGEWRVFTAAEARGGNEARPSSTHGVTVSSAIGIAAALGCDARLRILGIQAGPMLPRTTLSEEVLSSMPGVLQAIREEAEVMP
jgi:hydrogenase maturation protease